VKEEENNEDGGVDRPVQRRTRNRNIGKEQGLNDGEDYHNVIHSGYFYSAS